MKLALLTVVAAATIGLAAESADATSLQVRHKSFARMTDKEKVTWLKRQIHKDRSVIRFWTTYLKKYPYTNPKTRGQAWRETRWARVNLRIASRNLLRYRVTHRRASTPGRTGYPPHYQEWLCIHQYEGSWGDPGAPYYGGLQMDWGFMRAYGSDLLRAKGTADHWTPLEQMWVAERGLAVQGWGAWPNTARMCGLL